MNNNLQNMLLIVISIFLFMKYISPQNEINQKLNKKIEIIKKRTLQNKNLLNHKDEINNNIQKNKKIEKDLYTLFYNLKKEKTKTMTIIQKTVRHSLIQSNISDYKIDWLEINSNTKNILEELAIKIKFNSNLSSFSNFIKKLLENQKLLYIDNLTIYSVGGKDRYQKIQIIIILKAYRINKQ